jgi:Pretoxin HINT domain
METRRRTCALTPVQAESGSYAGNALYATVIQDCVAEGTQRRPVSADGACFVAGTLVHTKDGLVPIEHTKAGDWVLSQPETKGEVGYKRVVRSFSFEDEEVVCVDIWKNGPQERAGFVVTGNHPIWVKDVGWTRADHLSELQFLELADGSTGQVYNCDTVFRTDVEGVGWLDGFVRGLRGSGLGRTIDMRGARWCSTTRTSRTRKSIQPI